MEIIPNNESLITDVWQCMGDGVLTILGNDVSQVFDKAGMLRFLHFHVHLKKIPTKKYYILRMSLILQECV